MHFNTLQLAVLAFAAAHLCSTVTCSRILLQPNQLPGKQCPCPYIYKPVCGADGKQHANKCIAECAGVAVTEQNPTDPRQCARTAVDPVGSAPQGSGRLGPNPGGGLPPRPLNMNTNSAAVGAVKPPCRCPRIYLPVCGSDGKVYNNKCLAECEGVSATDVRPDANRNCPSNSGRRLQTADGALSQPAHVCPCPRIYKPVCGSNGRTYDNECLAKCDGVAVLGGAGGCQPGQLASGPGNTPPNNIPEQSGPASVGSRPTVPQGSGPGPTAASGPGATAASGPGPTAASGPGPTAASGPGPAAAVDQGLQGPSNPRQPAGQLGISCGCPVSYEPVCGKDARWYPNACSASCAGVGVSLVRPDKYGNCLVG